MLLLFLATACRTLWLMEQPKGSEDVFVLHERFQMLCNEVLFATQLQDYGCHICYMQVL